MCLITIIPPGKAAPIYLLKGSSTKNPHGTGIAWAKDGMVHWAKNIKNVEEFLKTVPTDCVRIVHDRLATVGPKSVSLIHPFLVSTRLADMPDSGSSKGNLLFHNGHWNEWKEGILSVAAARKLQIPHTDWSDSKALAFVTALLGEGAIELLIGTTMNRVCILTPNGNVRTYGDSWKEKEGCVFSNEYSFPTTYPKSYGGYGVYSGGIDEEEPKIEKREKVTALTTSVKSPLPDADDPKFCYYQSAAGKPLRLLKHAIDRIEDGKFLPYPYVDSITNAAQIREEAMELWILDAGNEEEKNRRKLKVFAAKQNYKKAKEIQDAENSASTAVVVAPKEPKKSKDWILKVSSKDASQWRWILSDSGKAKIIANQAVDLPGENQCKQVAASIWSRIKPEQKVGSSVEDVAKALQVAAYNLKKEAETEAATVKDVNDYSILA